MPTKAKCPKCGTILVLPDGGGGQVQCSGCGATLGMPAAPAGGPAAGGGAAGPRNMAPVITLAAVAVGVVILGLVVAMALKGGGSSSAVAYLPHDSKVVAAINVPAVVNSEFFRPVRDSEQYKSFEKDFEEHSGLKVDEIASVWFATPLPGPGGDFRTDAGEKSVFVIECTRPVDSQDFLKRAQDGDAAAKEEEVGSAIIYHTPGVSFHFPEPRLILGGDPTALRATLAPGRTAGLNSEMQGMMGSLDTGRAVALVGLVPSEMPDLPPGAPVPPDLAQKVKAATLHADFGTDLVLELVVLCKDDESADSLSKMAAGLVEMGKQNPDMPPDVKPMVDSFKINASGSKVTASITIPGSLVDKAVQGGMSLPFGSSTRAKKMPKPQE